MLTLSTLFPRQFVCWDPLLPQTPPEAEGGKPSFVVTTPEALTAVIRARLAAISGQTAPAAASAASATSASSSASASSSEAATVKARWRPGQGRTAQAPTDAGTDSTQPTASPPQPEQTSPQQLHSPQQQSVAVAAAKLPCGQPEAAVLAELVELVEEYDRAVYSRKTPLERMGHSPAPWLTS